MLHHEPTHITAQAGERRSQQDNLKAAIARLRLNLAVAHRLNVSADAEPSQLWRSRLHGTRIVVNPSHRDYPALLAEALDVLAAHDYQPAPAARQLRCSTSQLIKLIKHHPPALDHVNQTRATNQQHALK